MKFPRTHEVDVIRLFALLGICIVNINTMGVLTDTIGNVNPGFVVDEYIRFFSSLLIESKFIFLFSMILDWGIAIQEKRFEAAGGDFSSYYFRRALGLIVLGLLHTAFIFEGDILVTYGLLCLVFWSMKSYVLKAPFSALIKRLVCWNYGLWALIMVIGVLVVLVIGVEDFFSAVGNEALTLSFYEASVYRITNGLLVTLSGGLLFSVEGLAAFSLGYIAYHKGFFDPESELVEQLKKRVPMLLLIGVTLTIPYAIFMSGLSDSFWWATGILLLFISAPMMSISYLYFIIKFARRIQLPEVLVLAGRNTLSVYVLQGLIASLLFNGYGFNLIGAFSSISLLGISVIVYCVSVLVIGCYAKMFGQGILEPILRKISGTKSSVFSAN